MSDTNARIIARHLANAGCRHAFGMPGGEVLVMLEALREAGVEFTLCKHENAAGYMAEGAWHATGAPGIMLTTIGPGLANGVNAVANAYLEQVAMIVLSGCIDDDEAEQFTHQVIDQSALMAPITKAQFRVAQGDTGGTAAHVVQKALAVAMADPPGPVHIDLPVGLAAEDAVDVAISARVGRAAGWPGGDALGTAAAQLAAASNPLILAGLGAVHHAAGDAITKLSHAYDIPVITTYKAKGVMDENDPLCLGGHGLSPLSDKQILPLLRASDCVLLAGYDPIEMRSGWIQPWAGKAAIELAHADNNHGMHASAMRVIGNITSLVEQLHAGMPAAKAVWAGREPSAARAALRDDFQGPGHWGPHEVFHTLQAQAPDNAVVTVDSGAHRILISQMWRCARPRSLLQSTCFCTMGVAVPLAIGHTIAKPDTPVIAVVGDAGFDMSPGDLATLRDAKRPMAIIVLVDDALALIEKKQVLMQLPGYGVGFQPTDIPAVARAYGGHGVSVSDKASLIQELNDVWSRGTFTLIAARIDKMEYASAF